MLNITSHNGKAKIKVEESIAEIICDLTIAVRGLIESIADKDEMCADMLLGFCKYALPKLADPEVDLDDIDDILDETAKEHRKAAMVIKTIRDMLDDLEDDVK